MSVESQTTVHWENFWKEGQIPWHMETVNEYLTKFVDKLTRGRPNLCVFVPLCGKSLDLLWLADLGHIVMGVELAKQAIESFFDENSLTYKVESANMGETAELKEVYKCKEKEITIFCCDLFSLAEKDVGGKFDAIWDRGSLSAIAPETNGERYVRLMASLLSSDGRYMLESHRYEVDREGSPPANIPEEFLNELFGKQFTIEELDVAKFEEDPTRDLSFALDLHYHLLIPKSA